MRQKTKSKLEVSAKLKDGAKRNIVSSWENFGSNCWAIHGNHTKSGKPMLSCDPHLIKYTSPTWYAARISWNETTIEDTVESSYRTYIAGHSIVGIPLFTHIKTPFVAGGMTALNPDTMDLFLEEVKDDTYLASAGTWEQVGVLHEVIKVRFGSDVYLDVKYTDNGVLIPRDFVHEQTKTLAAHLLPEVFESDEALWDTGLMYALALTIDPLTHERLGPGEPFKNYVHLGKTARL